MQSEYVEERGGGYYIRGKRISLDSVVHAFNEGESAETILENFPSLTLSQVYGSIAFYLDHRADIDRYLEESQREFEAGGIPLSEANPDLWRRVEEYRARLSKADPDASRA